MNKYEKAYKEIEKLFKYEDAYGNPLEELAGVDEFSMGMIKELVDKETPVKPIKEGINYRCGVCLSYSVIDGSKCCGELKRCHECGQRIVWSKKYED